MSNAREGIYINNMIIIIIIIIIINHEK